VKEEKSKASEEKITPPSSEVKGVKACSPIEKS
jgi:hypothetical protein